MEKKQENDDYSFMQEQIKKRPINKKRLVKRAFTTGALAIMFGTIASLVFFLLEPVLTKLVSPKEEKQTISLLILVGTFVANYFFDVNLMVLLVIDALIGLVLLRAPECN